MIELSSVPEANRLMRLEQVEILGIQSPLIRCSESSYGTTVNMSLLVKNAENEALAMTTAVKTENILKNNQGVYFTISKYIRIQWKPASESVSTIRSRCQNIFNQILKIGRALDFFYIIKLNKDFGTEIGDGFAEFEDEQTAKKVN